MSIQGNKNKLDEYFKSAFESGELKPSENTWTGLETQFLNNQAEKDRRKIFFLRFLLATSVLFIVALGGLYIYNKNDKAALSNNYKKSVDSAPIEKNNSLMAHTKEKSNDSQSIIKEDNVNSRNVQSDDTDYNDVVSTTDADEKANDSKNSTKKDNVQSTHVQSDKTSHENKAKGVSTISKQKSNPQNSTDESRGKDANVVDASITANSSQQTKSLSQQNEQLNDEKSKNNSQEERVSSLKENESKNNIATLDSLLNKDSAISIQADTTNKNIQSNQAVAPASESKTSSAENSEELKKWQIGINVSLDYCYRTLKNNDGSFTSSYVIDSKNEYEVPKIGYTVGLSAAYNLKPFLSIEAGIHFSNKGYQTKMSELSYGDRIDSIASFYSSNSISNVPPIQPPSSTFEPIRAKFIYNNYYLDVPLRANLIIGKKKIRFISSAGITTNIFLFETSTSSIEYSDGTKEKNTQKTAYPYNRINISPMVSLGIDWKLNNKNTIRVEPTFRYGVLKIINTPVTGYLWNAGINIGYYFGVK